MHFCLEGISWSVKYAIKFFSSNGGIFFDPIIMLKLSISIENFKDDFISLCRIKG